MVYSRWFSFFIKGFILIACILTIASCQSSLDTPPKITWPWRIEGNFPIFTKSTIAEELGAIGSPDVQAYRTPQGQRRFRMAYAQGEGSTNGKGRIGLADSADGIQWDRVAAVGQASILVPSGNPSDWDHWFLDTPALLYHESIWYLWYFGDGDNGQEGGAIGLATSTDGIHFSRTATVPVLERGAAGQWDSGWVESPSVIFDGSQFIMYYTGGMDTSLPKIGRASSPDGVHWTKDPSNPVLGAGNPGTWDSYTSAVASATYRNGHHELFYCALSTEQVQKGQLQPRIGFATTDWSGVLHRAAANPIIDGSHCNWAPNGPYNPCVLFDDDSQRYYLWFETGLGFGLVTAAPLATN